jgi:hypothetical protein
MQQRQTRIIAFVNLAIGFASGFVLRPVIAPPSQTVPVAIPPVVAVPSEARGAQYFVAHIDEARQVVTGCQDGSVRDGECASVEEAIIKVEARERRKQFIHN